MILNARLDLNQFYNCFEKDIHWQYRGEQGSNFGPSNGSLKMINVKEIGV